MLRWKRHHLWIKETKLMQPKCCSYTSEIKHNESLDQNNPVPKSTSSEQVPKVWRRKKDTQSKPDKWKIPKKSCWGFFLASWLPLNCLCQTDFSRERQLALSVFMMDKQRFWTERIWSRKIILLETSGEGIARQTNGGQSSATTTEVVSSGPTWNENETEERWWRWRGGGNAWGGMGRGRRIWNRESYFS